jgi:hypothetical protein
LVQSEIITLTNLKGKAAAQPGSGFFVPVAVHPTASVVERIFAS